MTSGENSRIAIRLFISSYLEKIIKESVYYRSNSHYMKSDQKFIIGNILNQNSKTKLL